MMEQLCQYFSFFLKTIWQWLLIAADQRTPKLLETLHLYTRRSSRCKTKFNHQETCVARCHLKMFLGHQIIAVLNSATLRNVLLAKMSLILYAAEPNSESKKFLPFTTSIPLLILPSECSSFLFAIFSKCKKPTRACRHHQHCFRDTVTTIDLEDRHNATAQ